MKKLLQLFILLLCSAAFAQIKGTLQDSQTKEPVPYVNIWLEGENTGTTADENGQFTLPDTDGSKTVIFSAVGYGETRIKTNELKLVTYLEAKAIALNEVTIVPRKNKLRHIVNPMDAIDETYFAATCPDWNPIMMARYMPYREEYAKTPFLNEIKFLTHSNARNAIFYVRLYTVNKDGSPGELLHDNPIMGKAVSKKRSITTIDVSKLNIQVPETGFFVAIEWLIIERNQFIMHIAGSGKKGVICYSPTFKNVYTRGNAGRWIYQKGIWTHDKHLHDNKFFTIAVELTLTD